MYSMVLMVAMSGSGDVGALAANTGCAGEVVSTGCCGSKHGGLLARLRARHGCGGCTGTVVSHGCGHDVGGCSGKHRLFGGLFGKHRAGCAGCSGHVAPVTGCSGCSGVVPMPAPAPAPAPKAEDKKPMST